MADEQQYSGSIRGILEKAAAVILAAAIVAGAGALAGLHDRVLTRELVGTRVAADLADLTKRVEQQEQRPPRLSGLAEDMQRQLDNHAIDQRQCREQMITIQQTLQQVREYQADLCSRLRGCDELWKKLR